MFNGNDLPHELLLTTRQKAKLRNDISANLKLSKAQNSKIIQSGGFSGSLSSKLSGPLMKVSIPLAKNVLAPLRITTAAQQLMQESKKIHGSGTITLIISNEEINYIKQIDHQKKFKKSKIY